MIPFLLAQQSPPPQGGLVQLFFPFILVVGIFYLLIIRPMRTRQKNLETLIGGLKNGDKVITTGGIYGTISGVRDNTFVLKVADQVKMEIAKNAVASLQALPEGGDS
jgi:preprotein translocase subunit YajC